MHNSDKRMNCTQIKIELFHNWLKVLFKEKYSIGLSAEMIHKTVALWVGSYFVASCFWRGKRFTHPGFSLYGFRCLFLLHISKLLKVQLLIQEATY